MEMYDYIIPEKLVTEIQMDNTTILIAKHFVERFVKNYKKQCGLKKCLYFSKRDCIQTCLFIAIKVTNDLRIFNGKHFLKYTKMSLSQLNYVEYYILKILDHNLDILKNNFF